MIPAQTPLSTWEDATSWEDIFSGCGVLTPRTTWTRQPEREDDAATTQRWADDAGHSLVVCTNSPTGREEVWDDEAAPTGWLALTEEAQDVHQVGKIDVLAHVCGVSVADAAEAVGVFIDPLLDRFDIWQHGHMSTIARYAVSRGVSPYPVLGMVMATIAANTSPHLYIPGRRRAGLNFAVCGIGASGQGKGTSADLAYDLVHIPGEVPPRAKTLILATWQGAQKRMKMPDFDAEERLENAEKSEKSDGSISDAEIPPLEERTGFASGMGEGITYGLSHAPVVYDGKHAGRKYEFVHTNRHVARVDELAAFLGDRNGGGGGQGMQPLTSMVSSETVGGHLAGETREVPAHSYRFALAAFAQPVLVEPLLRDTAGGVAQRFLWVPATDLPPELDGDEACELLGGPVPEEGDVPVREEQIELDDTLRNRCGPLDVHQAIRAEMRRQRAGRRKFTAATMRSDIASDDGKAEGQLDLLILRTHFLVSVLLYGEMRSTVEAWTIAAALVDVSTWTRASVLIGAGQASRRARVAETAAGLEDKEAAEGEVERARLAQCAEKVAARLNEAGPSGVTVSALLKLVGPNRRAAMRAAIDEAVAAGSAQMTERHNANNTTTQVLTSTEAP